MVSIIQELHDSEINVALQSFLDGVFEVKIGDRVNGFDVRNQPS